MNKETEDRIAGLLFLFLISSAIYKQFQRVVPEHVIKAVFKCRMLQGLVNMVFQHRQRYSRKVCAVNNMGWISHREKYRYGMRIGITCEVIVYLIQRCITYFPLCTHDAVITVKCNRKT